jgi:hypothetical protein
MKKFKGFKDINYLIDLIEDYFKQALSDPKSKDQTIGLPTITGLALHLGFNSKEDFDLYESRGKYKTLIKTARFRIMAYYEGRLHYPAPTGAMFALKCMGWQDKPKAITKAPRKVKSITVKLVETGPQPASSEKEVQL